MAFPRIVITGLGGICGLGVDVASIWQSMIAGRSAIGPITIAPLHELKVRIGSEIKEMPDLGLGPPSPGDDGSLQPDRRHRCRRSAAPVRHRRHRRQYGAHRRGDRQRDIRRRDDRGQLPRAVRREADAGDSVLGAARHAERAGRPGQHGIRPARPGIRRHLGLLLVQSRDRLCGRPIAARPRRHHAGRRQRCAAGLRHPQGLGGAARGRPRNLPPVLGRP